MEENFQSPYIWTTHKYDLLRMGENSVAIDADKTPLILKKDEAIEFVKHLQEWIHEGDSIDGANI